MGNWNRRWLPRKKYTSYNYQEPLPFPPTRHHTQSYPPVSFVGGQNNSVPSWEIDFCKSMGVAWHKVVTAKKYIYCHDSIFKWNDIAGEEAYHNAKKRYWAKINGLPCDSPLPDPDIYIDEIDWNSYIDPKLILDLDREYFNPDEGGKKEKLYTVLKEVSSGSPVRNDKNAYDGDDPWESCVVQATGNVKCTTQNWGQWDTPTKLKTGDNPWEQSCHQVDNSLKNNAWKGSGDGPWGWNQGQKYNGQRPDIHNRAHNIRTQGRQSVESMRMKGWGHDEYNSWSTNKWKMNGCESSYPVDRSNNWGNNYFAGNASLNDRQRGDWRNKSQGWKHPESVNDESKYLDFRGQRGDGRAPYGGRRKREGSLQHASRYKSSKFQANDHGAAYQWQR